MDNALSWLTLAAAVGSGMVAGAFFGFSSFVMKALAKIPSAQGIAAMQSINVIVINPVFLGAMFGTALVCLGLGIWSVVGWSRDGMGYVLAGCLCYLIGTIGTTMVYNVPRNDALAAMDPNSAEAAAFWVKYVAEWTFANHLRTLAGAAAMVLFILALVKLARQASA